jgi:hypothetical protein
MKLPFEPEPIDKLHARYNEAIKRNYNIKAVELGLSARPGDQRQHVFDCTDGLRLIISRDDGQIHFSASVEPETILYRLLENKKFTKEQFLDNCLNRYKEISSCSFVQTYFYGFTEGKGVPHWFVQKQE